MVTSHQEESIQNEKGPRDGEPEPGACVPPSAHLSFASVNGSACVCAFGGGGEGGWGGGGTGERGVSRFTLAPGHEVLPGESNSGSVPGTSSAATLAGPAATKQPRTAAPQPSNPPIPQLHPSLYLVHAHQTRRSPGRGAASGPGSAAVLIDFAVTLCVRAADLGCAVHHTPSRSRLQPAASSPPPYQSLS